MYLCIWLLLNNTSLFVMLPAFILGVIGKGGGGGGESRVVLEA